MYLAHAAKVARCIQHDANHEPCPLEDRLEAGTGPHVVADPSRNLHWVRPRPVVVNRDYLELPSPKLHRWRTYIKSPVTLAIYAPANAAAGAGLLVGPPLVAGLPPAPPEWAVVLLLHGCAWSKPKVPVNRKKKLFAEKLLLGRAGLAAALAPLRTGAGQAAARWWFVTGRWHPGQGNASGVLALHVLPSSMIYHPSEGGSGSNGPGGRAGATAGQERDAASGEHSQGAGSAASGGGAENGGCGGEVDQGPLMNRDVKSNQLQRQGQEQDEVHRFEEGEDLEDLENLEEEEEEEEEEDPQRGNMGDHQQHMEDAEQSTEQLPPEGAQEGAREGAERDEQEQEGSPMKRQRVVGAASLAPAAAVAAASGGACDDGGGWDPTGLLPPVSEWQQVQVVMAQLLVKVQAHARNTAHPNPPHLLSPGDLLLLAARLLDPRPQSPQAFMAVQYRLLQMAVRHPHHLIRLLRVFAAQTPADHPLLQVAADRAEEVEAATHPGDAAAALQLLPAEPGGCQEELVAILDMLEQGMAVGSKAAADAALAAALLHPPLPNHTVVYPLVRAAAAIGGTVAAVLVLHMACPQPAHQPATPPP